ncbi:MULTISPECIES: hypothetical protein [unclassified Variovorax]|uniref:hypothetical protein n=1 Tax=unclassified Variovorax TaxID=663243 RepID=UPI003ECD2BFB
MTQLQVEEVVDIAQAQRLQALDELIASLLTERRPERYQLRALIQRPIYLKCFEERRLRDTASQQRTLPDDDSVKEGDFYPM